MFHGRAKGLFLNGFQNGKRVETVGPTFFFMSLNVIYNEREFKMFKFVSVS